MRPGPSSILALATTCLGLVSCSLVVDALGPYDSVTDAGAAHDSAGHASGTFCSSQDASPQLCADFDEGKPYNSGWTSVFVSGGGGLTLLPGVDVSPPDSLQANTPRFAAPAQSEPAAGLSYDFTGQARSVHLESQIRLDAVGPDQCFVALAITQQQPGGGPYLQAQLFLCADQGFAQEQDNSCACTQDDGLPNKLSLGSWHWYAIDVALGSNPAMTFWVDDPSTPVLDAVPLAYAWQASPFSVQAGIGYIGGGAGEAIQAEFDDVEAYVR